MRRAVVVGVAALVVAGCAPASARDDGSVDAQGLRRRITAVTSTTTTTAAPTTTSTTTTAVPVTTTTAAPAPTTTLPMSAIEPSFAAPFGNSPWNRPVAGMAAHPQSAEYASRMFNYGIQGGSSDPSLRGKFSTYFRDYSQPVYDARQANTTVQVFRAGFGFAGSVPNGGSIPWNDAWQPPTGNDAMMFIANPDTGRLYELWLVQTVNKTSCFTFENLFLGFSFDGHNICVGQSDVIQDASGHAVDYRTYEGGYPTGGAYIQDRAMVVTADEVATGTIPHALNAVVYNTMFGPQCTPQERYSSAAGVSCGFYENPASRLEWSSAPQQCGSATQQDSDIGRAKTVAEGMRFAVHMTDGQITAWLDSRGYSGALRNTARIFAVAARDYGFIVTNTSCWDTGFITDGTFNPVTQVKWAALGIPADGNMTLLHGLFTADNMGTVAASEPLTVGTRTPAA